MEQLDDALGKLLNDPGAMAQVMRLAQKYAPEQRVANVTNFKPITNNGNTFKTLYWFVNRDAPNDLSAWRRADEGTTTRID